MAPREGLSQLWACLGAQVSPCFTLRPSPLLSSLLALSVRLRWVVAAPARSAATLCPGRLMLFDLKSVSVAFCALGSFLPTRCLARLKSTPTPGLRFLARLLVGLPPIAGTLVDEGLDQGGGRLLLPWFGGRCRLAAA